MGSKIVDPGPRCNYIMEYVNIISQTVFQQDSRHVLPHVLLQRECALHGGVYVHVPHNMSVIHNMSFFAELGTHQFEEFNSSICAIFESQHFVDNIAVNQGPTSPRCSTLMPSFDKMILSKSPTGAVTTAFYHATDRHVVTANKEQYVLTSVTASKDQQFVRLGNKTMNLLNRAYTMPQLQVECGSTVKFTTDEISSTEHWTLMSNNDQAVMAKVATTLSWSNRSLWAYNYVFPTAVVTNNDSGHWRALLQAIHYAGATCLNRLPQQEFQRLWDLGTDNLHFMRCNS